MYALITLILLQFNLLGNSGEAVRGTKVSIIESKSSKTIGFVEVGYSGKFLFANLDPGNYIISMEIPENAVKKIDKREKNKYETDIEVAYNKEKQTFCWQRADGYLFVEFGNDKKVDELFNPKFEPIEEILKGKNKHEEEQYSKSYDIPRTGEEKDMLPEDEVTNKKSKKKQKETIEPEKLAILEVTGTGEYGMIGGEITSISQRDFYKLVVGKEDMPLEVLGEIEILKKMD